MKYLKLFESGLGKTNEPYYTQISHWGADGTRWRITDAERNKIIDAFPSEFYRILRVGKTRGSLHYIAGNHQDSIFIDVMLDSDEWYDVRMVEVIGEVKYYRCDQLEGVIQCIKERVYKVFNESSIFESVDPPYERITYASYIEYRQTHTFVEIPVKEVNSIVTLLSSVRQHVGILHQGGDTLKLELSRYDSLILRKMEDEWYFVIKDYIVYKCDQWEGLLKCIEDEDL